MRTLRRTFAEINLENLEYNYKKIKEHIGGSTKILGVVKADGYGHGAVAVAKCLEKSGADYFAVSNIYEAKELREGGIKAPILMLGFTPADMSEEILSLDMTQTVTDYETAKAYSDFAVSSDTKIKVHIKLDTGMGRLGFQCDDYNYNRSKTEILKVIKLAGLDIEGVFTHFAVSDEDSAESINYTEMQYNKFLKIIGEIENAAAFKFRLKHCANSGAVINYPQFALDMVRCGIIMYGVGDDSEKLGLKPVMSLKTTVSEIKEYDKGAYISYGRACEIKAKTRIAVLPIGYADGLLRALSGKFSVLTPYGAAKQIGRICMDMCMIDATNFPDLKRGDEIEIFGENISVNHLAKTIDTIPYELLCSVSKRVPRIIK